MQAPFSCTPSTFANVERAFSRARIGRFLPAANGDKQFALRLLVWNAKLCEAAYTPLQIAEVSLRNTLHSALILRYGVGWETQGRFTCNLTVRLKEELDSIIRKERATRGAAFTIDHIVAGLSFGFWVHLLTRSFDHLLWKSGIFPVFPNAPKGTTRIYTHEKVEQFRKWRNLIAHHYAIFDKRPVAEQSNIFEIVGWIDDDVGWLAKELSELSTVINKRPRA
jgi:hypothetical protein